MAKHPASYARKSYSRKAGDKSEHSKIAMPMMSGAEKMRKGKMMMPPMMSEQEMGAMMGGKTGKTSKGRGKK